VKPEHLAVVAAFMRTQTKVRRPCPSRQPRSTCLSPAQLKYLNEQHKLDAEARRERRNAKRARTATP
jgi:hypothetical protein